MVMCSLPAELRSWITHSLLQCLQQCTLLSAACGAERKASGHQLFSYPGAAPGRTSQVVGSCCRESAMLMCSLLLPASSTEIMNDSCALAVPVEVHPAQCCLLGRGQFIGSVHTPVLHLGAQVMSGGPAAGTLPAPGCRGRGAELRLRASPAGHAGAPPPQHAAVLACPAWWLFQGGLQSSPAAGGACRARWLSSTRCSTTLL